MKNTIKSIYRFLSPKFQTLFLEYKVNFKPRYGFGKAPHHDLYKIIDNNRNNYKELLNKALKYKNNIWTIEPSKKIR